MSGNHLVDPGDMPSVLDIQYAYPSANNNFARQPDYSHTPIDAERVEIETHFKDASGAACGTYLVKFVKLQSVNDAPRYRVNNTDIADLLRLISLCAVYTEE